VSGTAKKKTSRRSRRGGKAATKETVSKDVKKEEPLVEDAEVVETPKAEKAPDVKAEEAPKEESEKKDEAKGE
jgi:hypothetical protein